jgi:DNA-3-methyladenine glycosylase
VLIRALVPTSGLAVMRRRRRVRDERLLCSGPGRVCQALGISRAQNGLPLDAPPFELYRGDGRVEIAAGPRIGISKATEHPWRFGLARSPYLSRPFPT